MTDQTQSSAGSSPKPCCRLGGSLIAQLCVTAVLIGVTAHTWASMIPPSALHFGMEADGAFTRSLVLVGLFCIFTTACLVWLGQGVKRVLQRRADWWVPWVFIGAVGAFAFGLGAWSERHPPHQPITAAEEALYLEFAKTAREQIGDKVGYLSFDPNYGGPRTAKEDEISEGLLPMVPDYWPHRFLVVYLEKECVVLTRGTGMLGQVGVRIYDHGPVTAHSAEELRANPYLPRQQKITDRLWFFTSG